MIKKVVYKIFKSDLEKIHQEIRIRANMDNVDKVYEAEISNDSDEESDDELFTLNKGGKLNIYNDDYNKHYTLYLFLQRLRVLICTRLII